MPRFSNRGYMDSPTSAGGGEERKALWYTIVGMKALGLDRPEVTPLEREIPQ